MAIHPMFTAGGRWQPRTALRLASALLLGLSAAGCAVTPAPPVASAWPEPPLADALFAASDEPVSTDDLLRLTPDMQAYLQQQLARPGSASQALQIGLIEQLYRRDGLQLHYDDATTRSPTQAFADRRGNCLSLALMTAAFARALGLQAEFQAVHDVDLLDRSADLVLRSGHVNVRVLAPASRDLLRQTWDRTALVVDFVPEGALRGARVQPMSDQAVLALFQNNRAAEALQAGRMDAAYAWARASVLADPAQAHALNTLGVVYQRRGLPTLAEAAWRQTLQRDGQHLSALGNLRDLLLAQGRHAEAAPITARLATLQAEPPFAALDAGQQALARGDAGTALALLQRAARQYRESAEVQFWLARAWVQLGQPAAAGQALQQALALSQREPDRQRYSAKLAWLRAQGLPGPADPPTR